MLTLMMIVYRK